MGPTEGCSTPCALEQAWEAGVGDVATPGGEAEHRAWCWDVEDSDSPRETPHQAGGTGVGAAGPEAERQSPGQEAAQRGLHAVLKEQHGEDGGEAEPPRDLPTVAWVRVHVCV